MGDEYQNRRDIDKIYDDLYDQINGSLNVLKFDKDSEFKNISSKEDGSDVGTIDAIINYYQLTEKGGGGGGDLSDYYTKTEINTILSSYVTNETLDDYALKSELFSGSYNDLDDVPSTFPPSSHSHNWDSVTGKPSTFPPSSHNHDDIYYTEHEIDTILSSYATSSEVTSRLAEYVKLSYATATFSPKSHNHDTRYYLQSEIDSQMYDKSDRWHTHSTDGISDENVSDYTEIYKHTLPSTPAKLTHDLYAIDTELGYKVDTNDSRLSDARTPTAHSHSISDVTNLQTTLNGKQPLLQSGTNIKTVNGNDLLGSGDIVIGGTGTIDDTVTQNSSNPVKSSGIYSALSNKANTSDLTWNNINNKPSTFSPSSHSHSISDVTDLLTYEISSSNYNPNIDSTVTITITVKNSNGNIVPNHQFTLNADGTNVSLTTNSNGIATYNYTCSSWGLHTFSVKGNSIQIKVGGYKTQSLTGVTLYYTDHEVNAVVNHTQNLTGSSTANAWTNSSASAIPSGLRPRIHQFAPSMSSNVRVRVNVNGNIQYQTTSKTSNYQLQGNFCWFI